MNFQTKKISPVKMRSICCLLFIILVLCTLVGATPKLVMAQVFFRHGARYSMHGEILEKYARQQEIIQNKGELTEVGKRQLFLLGKRLREDFLEQQLISSHFNSSEIFIQSSNVNRALQSAQSFMHGLFPKGTGEEFLSEVPNELLIPPFQYDNNDEIQLHPRPSDKFTLPDGLNAFPIHSLGNYDYVLNSPCSKEKEIKKSQLKANLNKINEEVSKYTAQINEITKKLQLNGNFTDNTITKVQDIATSLKFMGITQGLTQKEYQLLNYLKSYTKSLYIFTPDFSRIVASPIFDFIFEQFDNKVAGQSSNKVVIESSHDGQLIPLMVVLGLISADCLKYDYYNEASTCQKYPPYASNLIFELYQSDELYEIKIKFNGKYIKLCGSNDVCDYNTFKKSTHSWYLNPTQYSKKCGAIKDQYQPTPALPSSHSDNKTLYLIIIITLAILLVVSLFYIRKLKKELLADYQKFNQKNEI